MLSRLKFDTQDLFEEVYKRLPESLFLSDKTTFADLQSAGLQSIVPLVDKLREYGHSDDNIRSRVFAFMENDVYLNYVIVKFSGLPVTFDIYKESINMKFDVVVGNPPFQDPSSPKNKSKLWTSFVQKGIDLVNENGYTFLICPDTWTSPSRETNVKEKILKQFKEKNLILANFKTPNEYMNVGVNMSYFLLKNNKEYSGTHFVTKESEFDALLPNDIFLPKIIDKNYMSILSKVMSHSKKMTFKHYSSGVTSRVKFSETQENEFNYPYFNTGGGINNVSIMYGDRQDTKGLFGQRKIHTSGFGGYRIQLDNDGAYGSMHNGYCFLLGDIVASTLGVNSYFSTKLIRMILEPNLWHQYVEPKILSLLPLVDLEKVWTNKELCDYLKLTEDEIEYVESYVL